MKSRPFMAALNRKPDTAHNLKPGTQNSKLTMLPTISSFTANGRSNHWIGLDIGGTKTEVLVVDGNEQIIGQAVAPTDIRSPEQLVAGVIAAAQQALTQANEDMANVAALGVGVPGQIQQDTGVVALAVNLNLINYPLGPILSQQLGKPCYLENDVRAAAVGAYHSALSTQHSVLSHLAYLSIGTGIAAGLILNGQLYRGANGMAGEIGHIALAPEGERCACGQIGCLETIAAGPAIVRQAEQAGLTVAHAGEVYAAAKAGHAQAQSIVNRVSESLSRALQWLVMTYDVEKLVLGGGVTSAGTAFLEPIFQALARLRADSPLAQAMLPDAKLSLLPAGFNAGAWGAIALAQQKMGEIERLRD